MNLHRFRSALYAWLLLATSPLMAAEQSSFVTPIAGPMNMATFTTTYLNPALRALASCHWGASAPANGPGTAPIAYQCWADTTSNPVLIKRYDGAQWVVEGALDTTAHTWTPYRQGAAIAAVATSSSASDLTTGTLPAARLPNPSASTLGGTQSKTCSSSNWLNSISTSGVPGCSQPSFADLTGSIACLQLPAITGDVTRSAGSCASTLANIPTATPMAGSVLATNIVAPSTPAAGKTSVYVDSTDKRLHDKNDAGTVATTSVPSTCSSSNWFRTLSSAGVLGCSQPSFADLSSSLSCAQHPALTGDVTTSAGSCATTIANSAVSNAKMASMAANTVKANATGSSAAPTDVTAATARSSSLLNVDSFTGHGDSAYTILSTDRTVGTNAAFTASRTWTLPTANSVNPGQQIVVADFQGTVTATNTLVIQRAGADTVNGGTSTTISAANGAYLFSSDGVSKWTAQALGAAAAGGVSSVTCGTGLSGGTITTSGACAVNLAVLANSLGADVSLNNTANYFDGPSVAQGTSGTWFASGTVTVLDTTNAVIYCKLWDGTTVISSASTVILSASTYSPVALSGYLASPAGNIKISCRDISNTTGKMLFNQTGNSKDSSISVHRIQ
ncbi:hypothetical protein [Bradyrhizobium japonicum]|uniref:hypothetical protein n=1 Tax=Bradyrhizobium japonicum TaxID=375 RepID=UPI000B1D630D|nr:hypothetical protein [Bradyrhizobium japonicum]